ncbi:Gfo/Idh/MocA family oxidoreductase [Actinophytocola sp.]|jgi:predicted dehydrogenase|uniref:Gfo/Idh/MocA family protein n=1 Tax=Actinophytocola sp. TaxID=1872138 RepID=UPI002ED8EE72
MTACRIGFVGAGGVAARHARMLGELGDVRLVAVTDPVPDRCQQFASAFGMRAAPGLAQLLSADLDAVYVCVPPVAHGPIEEAVVGAGLAMFVEKPLGLDEPTADRVSAAVTRAGVTTAVGHHWRYAATVRSAQRLLEGRAVRLVLGSWLDKVPPVPWWTHREQSGGQVVEQAVHVLDLARLLVGEVEEVCAMAGGQAPGPGADVDAATGAVLRFAGGTVGTLAATCVLRGKHRAGLELYADGFELSLAENGMLAREGDADPRWWSVNPDVAKRAADEAFVAAVLGRAAAVRVPYAEALRTHRLACAISTSAATRRPVLLGTEPHARI